MWSKHGELIKGSRCPKCHSPLVYNGNYWCSTCDYIMPSPCATKKDKHAFDVAYTLLMQQRNKQPDISVLFLVDEK